MADKRRPRACDTCHSIKIKCELGSTGGEPPCGRCQRLGKECTVSPPKRQKDRVAELEAQVEALTKLLQTQNLQSEATPAVSLESTPPSQGDGTAPRSSVTTTEALPNVHKKRRLDDDFTPPPSDSERGSVDGRTRFELDFVLPQDVQEELLARYIRDLVPFFPVVPIAGDRSYETMRKERPLLLQSAIYCASFGALNLDKQEDVGKVVMDLFSEKAMSQEAKSAELIQAIQAAVMYYRATKHHTHLAAWQFIQLAGGLAEEIGIGGPNRPPSLNAPAGGPYFDSSEAWRTWLVCHMLSATLALFMRTPNASAWDGRDENNLQMLEFSYFRMDTDELLCQHVRAERVCDQVATQQCLYDNVPTVDLADPLVQAGMQRLQDLITDWRSQVPPAINGPVMQFWENAATLYLHEPLLHTVTNQASFAAPFIAPRISITDFPKPLVSQQHIASLYKLRACAHAVIDVFETFDLPHLIGLPAMYFAGRVAYASYIMAKLYVALVAPDNTLGAFIDPESLQLDFYFEKIIRCHNKIATIDEWCGQARILSGVFRMREWYLNYRNNFIALSSKERQVSGDLSASQFTTMATSTAPLPADWNNMNFIDSTQDLGLEEFFADPQLTDWFPQPSDVSGATSTMGPGYL